MEKANKADEPVVDIDRGSIDNAADYDALLSKLLSEKAKELEVNMEKTNKETLQVGRLALRREAEYWVARWEFNDDLAPLYIAKIKFGLVSNHPQVRQAFIDLCKLAATTVIAEATGETAFFKEEPAPESDRAGHG
jgi:hypothetical protein